jgi:hypothetical protein
MVTHANIIQDLESIYQLSMAEGNLSLAIKAKELQGKELEIIQKNNSRIHPLKSVKIDNLIQLAQKYQNRKEGEKS